MPRRMSFGSPRWESRCCASSSSPSRMARIAVSKKSTTRLLASIDHGSHRFANAYGSMNSGLSVFRKTSTKSSSEPSGHHLRDGHRIKATSILAGLHHEYRLVEAA
jgi:hypothetical protein